jgi:hypothetical protein
MRTGWRRNPDVLAGLMFIAFGLVAMGIVAKNYPVSTSINIGPGSLPTLLGGPLTALGLYALLRSYQACHDPGDLGPPAAYPAHPGHRRRRIPHGPPRADAGARGPFLS